MNLIFFQLYKIYLLEFKKKKKEKIEINIKLFNINFSLFLIDIARYTYFMLITYFINHIVANKYRIHLPVFIVLEPKYIEIIV